MTIKSVSRFETQDGRLFEDRQDALRHDAQSKVLRQIKTILQENNVGSVAANLALDLLNKPAVATALRDALNKSLDYQRRYGKLKVAKP